MMRRTCDWCGNAPTHSFRVPAPFAGVPDDPQPVDFCPEHCAAAVQHVARLTLDKPYPTDIGFVVIDA